MNGQCTDGQHGHRNDCQADPRRHIALAKKAVSETINHVKEGVQVTQALPKRGQGMNGIKNTRQEGHGHDDKALESRHLVKFFGPKTCHQTQGAQQARTQDGKDQNPNWRMVLH